MVLLVADTFSTVMTKCQKDSDGTILYDNFVDMLIRFVEKEGSSPPPPPLPPKSFPKSFVSFSEKISFFQQRLMGRNQ